MKSVNQKEKNLYMLLVKNYLIFSLTFVLLMAVIYQVEILLEDRLSEGVRAGRQIRFQEALISGDYENLSLKKLVRTTGYYEVVTKEGALIYSEQKASEAPFNQEELSCIPDYNETISYKKTVYQDQSGREQILIRKSSYDRETGYREDLGYGIYNEDLELQYKSQEEMPKKLTSQELILLTGGLNNGYRIYKYPFTDTNGTELYLLLYIKEMDASRYQRVTLLRQIFIPLYAFVYILITIGFTIRMHRQVKTPMNMLEKGITDFAQGKLDTEISYQGPREFEAIFCSFNRMARKLQESEMAKEHLIEEKQRMLADISHDLKTPITVIQGYARAAMDENLVDEQERKQYLNTIVLKTEALTEMINNFYDYSKLEHPEFRLVRKTMDLAEYVREYLAEKYDEIDLMGFELEAEIPDEVMEFSFDQVQMKRVFDNLLNNSLKHNPKGTVIYVTMQQTDKNIQIEIGDNGVGIPKELQSELFEPFTVGDDSRNHKQGSGLGLSVAKKITELHGGALTLARTEQKGRVSTLFVLNFIR